MWNPSGNRSENPTPEGQNAAPKKKFPRWNELPVEAFQADERAARAWAGRYRDDTVALYGGFRIYRAMNIMSNDMGGSRVKRGRAGEQNTLGPNSEIGRKLKQYYEGLVAEQIPDRFTELLSKLEKTESGGKED